MKKRDTVVWGQLNNVDNKMIDYKGGVYHYIASPLTFAFGFIEFIETF